MTLSTEVRPRPPVRRAAPALRDEPSAYRRHHLVIYLLIGTIAFSAASAFAWVLNVSLKTNQEFLGTRPWSIAEDFHLENYANAWTNADVGGYFGNSVVVSITATLLGVVVAAFAAYPIGADSASV